MEPDDLGTNSLLGWIPFAISWEQSEPLIDWCHVGTRRFVEPFFDQTIHQLQQDPDHRRGFRMTPVEVLSDPRLSPPTPEPTGFIFHAARCGSTLVSQMVAAIASVRVLSEPNILNSFLTCVRPNSPWCKERKTDEQNVRLLRGLVASLGRSQRPEERHYVIKFDSAAILAMPLIRRAFPRVPWTFVYREPLEILGAQLRGHQTLPPGLANAGLLEGDPVELARMAPEEFWARILASRLASAVEAVATGEALLLNYRQLPDAVWQSLLPFFGLSCSQNDRILMQAAAKLNAKNPAKDFVDDSHQKRSAASPAVGALVDSLVATHYRHLESIRAGQRFLANEASTTPAL